MIGTVGVIGAGAWGTALALAVSRAGRPVRLWGRDPVASERLLMTRAHPALPGVVLDPAIEITADLGRLADAAILLLAVPTQALRSVAEAAALVTRSGVAAISAAKGVERGTGRFVTEVLAETMPAANAGVLSGPSFAADVAAGKPTAITLALHDATMAQAVAAWLGSPGLRLYHSEDVRGVEIGGAAKNVLAIGAGVVEGAGLGESARAALVARGFAELRRFGAAYGARPETLMGLSGLGDLLLTASSPQSRNYALGLALGRGEPPSGALAEGAWTAPALLELSRARGVDMPVCEAVDALLAGRATVGALRETMFERPQRREE